LGELEVLNQAQVLGSSQNGRMQKVKLLWNSLKARC
jgi:hypothetical protein